MNAAQGVRMAARIVDTPCNEMNTDHFLDVSETITLFGSTTIRNMVLIIILMQLLVSDINFCFRRSELWELNWE